MKIVFLLCSPDISGGTNVILEHAGALLQLGHEVTVATTEKIDPSRYAWHRQGAALQWRTIDELQGQPQDVAIATWWESPYLLSQVSATHCVYFVQSIESKFFPPEDPACLDTRDHAAGVTRCSNGYYFSLPIITEATWIRDYLETHYNHQPYLVRNGIRKELYLGDECLAPRRKAGLRVLVEGPVDVFHKNVPRTVEVCRQAGVDEIWLLTSSPIQTFPGVDRVFSRIPFDLTPPVYRSCDVLVKLSYVEGMFGPPLEMFHCGGTAIVYDVTGHDEYIRHGVNGLVAAKDDEQAVIGFLKELKNNPRRLDALCAEAGITAGSWPDWSTAGEQFAGVLQTILRTKPVSRTYLQNITETFTVHQQQQLQARELARFARREMGEGEAPGVLDNFIQLYGECMVMSPGARPWAHYRCGVRVEVSTVVAVTGKVLQLRIDPSVRIGIIRLHSLKISALPGKRTLGEFLPGSRFNELYVTGTARWLEKNEDHWVIESCGDDPQVLLPNLELHEGEKEVLVEVSLQEMGFAEYIGLRTEQPLPPPSRSRLRKMVSGLGVVTLLALILSWKMIAGQPLPVILDTDLSSDVDDVGAVAVLHSLANEGKAAILAMMISSGDPWAGRCLRALNHFFGRPFIPVGQVAGRAVPDTSKYTHAIGEEFGAGVAGNGPSTNAVALYRKILAGQPDHAVVIVTIGYLTNLHNLLLSEPDPVSPLNGRELVRQKVKRLVAMGGQYPKGREWNFYQDPEATASVVAGWPTPILFCGYESGVRVMTGSGLRHTPEGNPLRRSYELYNGLSDRPSWDQLTVLYAVEGGHGFSWTEPRLFTVYTGENTISADGGNVWRNTTSAKDGYLQNKLGNGDLQKEIDKHMVGAVTRVVR